MSGVHHDENVVRTPTTSSDGRVRETIVVRSTGNGTHVVPAISVATANAGTVRGRGRMATNPWPKRGTPLTKVLRSGRKKPHVDFSRRRSEEKHDNDSKTDMSGVEEEKTLILRRVKGRVETWILMPSKYNRTRFMKK